VIRFVIAIVIKILQGASVFCVVLCMEVDVAHVMRINVVNVHQGIIYPLMGKVA